jgi:hypothetical protein
MLHDPQLTIKAIHVVNAVRHLIEPDNLRSTVRAAFPEIDEAQIDEAIRIAPGTQVPDDVDLSAPDEVIGEIPEIPTNAMYGKLGEIAVLTNTPSGFAYPAAIAAASGIGIAQKGYIRPTTYVALIGPVGSGKSVTRERMHGAFRTNTHFDDQAHSHIISRIPASDQGFFKAFKDANGSSRLLSIDEFRYMLSKTSIEHNSTLSNVMNTLWSADEAGSVTKTTDGSVNVKLSILGGLTIKHASEFADVFSFDTAHGLYDRFIFGHAGSGWQFKPSDLKPVDLNVVTPLELPHGLIERTNAWRNAKPDSRARLGEIAMRVAYIASAVNDDSTITNESIDAAFAFVEWQEQIRSVYRPAQGKNEWDECMSTVLDAFEKAPGRALN